MSKKHPPDRDALPTLANPSAAQMARFVLDDGAVLEVHIPNATTAVCRPSAATTPGFILRRGRRIVNVGPLRAVFHE